MGGLDYPCAVQVMRVKVWETRGQDGAKASLDVTAAQCYQRGTNGTIGRRVKERNKRGMKDRKAN